MIFDLLYAYSPTNKELTPWYVVVEWQEMGSLVSCLDQRNTLYLESQYSLQETPVLEEQLRKVLLSLTPSKVRINDNLTGWGTDRLSSLFHSSNLTLGLPILFKSKDIP